MDARKTLRSFIVLLGLTISTAVLADEADPFGSAKWQDLGTENGVKLGRKNIPNSELFAVRGEAVIPAPVARVASVIYDYSRWMEWTKAMSGVKLLNEDAAGHKRTIYQAFDLPFPVTDRDVVYTYGWTIKDGAVKIEGRTLPVKNEPESNGVRMFLVTGRWFLTPLDGDKKTHLVLEILMDPKGSMPSWFVNLIQRRYPVETLGRLIEQVRKPDVEPLKLEEEVALSPSPLPSPSASAASAPAAK